LFYFSYNEFNNKEASTASIASMSYDYELRNEFDDEETSTAAIVTRMIIDDEYDNSFKSENYSSENENLLEDTDFSESGNESLLGDNNAVNILQEGIHSDDESLSDFDNLNLTEGNNTYNILFKII
jgi:hypothetical protein